MVTYATSETHPTQPSGKLRKRGQLLKTMGRSSPLYEFLELSALDTVLYYEDFVMDHVGEAPFWTPASSSGSVDLAHGGGVGGTATMVCDDDDGDYSDIYGTDAGWYAQYRCGMAGRLKVDDTSYCAVEFGFTDASDDTGGAIGADTDISSSVAFTADDCAILTMTGAVGESVYACTSGDTDSLTALATDTGFDMADGEWIEFMILCCGTGSDTVPVGDVRFYVNEQLAAHHTGATYGVATSVNLYPWVSIHEYGAAGTSTTLTMDYIMIWQNRVD